jgi:hypothetical protein
VHIKKVDELVNYSNAWCHSEAADSDESEIGRLCKVAALSNCLLPCPVPGQKNFGALQYGDCSLNVKEIQGHLKTLLTQLQDLFGAYEPFPALEAAFLESLYTENRAALESLIESMSQKNPAIHGSLMRFMEDNERAILCVRSAYLAFNEDLLAASEAAESIHE